MIFVFDIRPKPKESAYTGRKVSFTRRKDKFYRRTIKYLAQEQMQKNGWQKIDKHKPVGCSIYYFYKRGKSVKREHMTVRPDLDNLTKNLLDPLNDVVYCDDSQIIKLHLEKHYTTDSNDYIMVHINEID